jgi:hypothetical protein
MVLLVVQKNLNNTVWIYVKAVSSFVKAIKLAGSVDAL